MPENPESPLQPMLRTLKRHCDLSVDEQAAVLALPHQVRIIEGGNYMVRQGARPDPANALAMRIRHPAGR